LVALERLELLAVRHWSIDPLLETLERGATSPESNSSG
jgi:hypothetical protein